MDAGPDLSKITVLAEAHDTCSFDCGKPELTGGLVIRAWRTSTVVTLARMCFYKVT